MFAKYGFCSLIVSVSCNPFLVVTVSQNFSIQTSMFVMPITILWWLKFLEVFYSLATQCHKSVYITTLS